MRQVNFSDSEYNTNSHGIVEGYIDRLRGNAIEGWVWDSLRPSSAILVALLGHGGEVISVATADEFRCDLAAAGKDNGAHGFTMKFPEGTNILGMHVFAVEYGHELVGSPLLSPEMKDERKQDVFDRLGETSLRTNSLSNYLDRLEREISYKVSLLMQRAAELKDRFGVLHGSAPSFLPANKLTDVIFFPPIDWSYRIQRPQRLAAGLAGLGCRVWYVSPQMLPPSTGRAAYVIYDEPAPGVFLVKVRCNYPHSEINRAPLSPAAVSAVEQAFAELFKLQGIERPFCVIGSAGWQPVLDSFLGGIAIYDLMDWLAGFSATTPALLKAECELAARAQMIVCSSAALQDYAATKFKRQDTLLLRNATHVEMFALLAPEGTPVVGYVGAIEHWFDRDLVIEVAKALPEVQFILVGHVSLMHDALHGVDNISCVGECEPDKVAEYVRQFHVGIIPFLDNELIRHTDPVKVYEYLAAGRHVVATDLPELKRFKKWVTIARTPAEFVAGIRDGLRKAGDPKAIAARKQLVVNDTWAARAATLHAAMLSRMGQVCVK